MRRLHSRNIGLDNCSSQALHSAHPSSVPQRNGHELGKALQTTRSGLGKARQQPCHQKCPWDICTVACTGFIQQEQQPTFSPWCVSGKTPAVKAVLQSRAGGRRSPPASHPTGWQTSIAHSRTSLRPAPRPQCLAGNQCQQIPST